MTADRFLGAGFASVHGPADPRALLLWTLDRGFAGLFAAPSPRPVDYLGMIAVKENLPFAFGGTRVSRSGGAEAPAEAGLASSNEGDRKAALAVVSAKVQLATRLGTGRVVLDPGLVQVSGEVAHTDLSSRAADWTEESAGALQARRGVHFDRALENSCRSLHQLCKSFPSVEFCLTLSTNLLSVGGPDGVFLILEDLSRYRLGYWHDTVAGAARQSFLGQDPGAVLENGSKYLRGMTLGDFGGGEAFLPPGAGGVDYPLLSAYRQQSTRAFPVVIDLDPSVDPGEIPGIHSYLAKFGL